MDDEQQKHSTLITEKEQLTEVFKEVIEGVLTNVRMHSPELLNESEVALLLGVKSQTLAVWRHNGVGPSYIKVGSNVRYRNKDIEAYLEQNRVPR